MHADYSMELGPEDPALELPWKAEDGSSRYFNLKRSPDLVLSIPEAAKYPELSAFLSRINAPGFPLETAKCDAWFTEEMSPEDEVFGAACKFVSYVDLVFVPVELRSSLEKYEALTQDLCRLLQRAPEMAAGAEFILRRCYYHVDDKPDNSTEGFCITAYVTGYGDNQEEAGKRWAIALKLLQYALVQISVGLTQNQNLPRRHGDTEKS